MAVSPVVRARVLARSPVCRICLRAPATCVDHIWPLAYGGSDDEGNLQAACRSCNCRKKDELPAGMLPLYGRLDRVVRVRRDDGPSPHAVACSRAWHERRRGRLIVAALMGRWPFAS